MSQIPPGSARQAWIAPALFAFIAALYVAPAFLPGQVLLPVDIVRDYGAWKTDPQARVATSNRMLADPLTEFAAWDHVSRNLLAEGALPWRNPFAAGGAHLYANPETGFLSPMAWPRLLFGVRGWALTGFLRLFVAGLAMFWLIRQLGGTRNAALFGGAVYMTSGYVVVWLLFSHATVFALLPALAAAVLRSLEDASPGRLLTVVVLAALAVAGGHPETLAHLVIAFGLLLLVHGLRSRPWRTGAVVRTALAAIAGLLLIGMQLVPFFAALAESHVYVARKSAFQGFRTHAVAAQLLPGYLGSPLRNEIDLTGFFPTAENFNERSGGFIGLTAVLLLLAGSPGLPLLHRRMLLGGFIALLISWRTPLLWQLVHQLPLFSRGANERLACAFVMLAVPAVAFLVFSPRRFPRLGKALLILGAVTAASGLFLSTDWSLALLQQAADRGVASLIGRGYLTKGIEFYQERMQIYLDGLQATALHRAFLPGCCWAIAGFGLLRAKPLLVAGAMLLELLTFGVGYNPAVRLDGETALRPPLVVAQLKALDPASESQVAVLGDAIPANLLTFHAVRDLRSYDVLQTREFIAHLASAGYDPVTREFPDRGDAAFVEQLRGLGARFIIGRSVPEGTTQVGGLPAPAVGLYEIASPAPPAAASNEPPRGLIAGGGVSVLGLLLAAVLAATTRSASDPPRQAAVIDRSEF